MQNLSTSFHTRTYNEAHHGAQVAGTATQIKEGESWLELEGLHHLGVDARGRQVDVAVLPRQVLVGAVPVAVQVVVPAVDGPKSLLHFLSADVLRPLQVVDEVVVVLTGAHGSPHGDDRDEETLGGGIWSRQVLPV